MHNIENMSKIVSRFERLGIKVDYFVNLKFMQVPIVGDDGFIVEWLESKMGTIRTMLEGSRSLSSRHVALDLLKGAWDACRVVYYLHTTPADMVHDFIREFDIEVRDTFEGIVALVLSDDQWRQATLGVKFSGLGVCSASRICDAAYLASRAKTFEDCCALDGVHVWDDGHVRNGDSVDVIGEWLLGASTDMMH